MAPKPTTPTTTPPAACTCPRPSRACGASTASSPPKPARSSPTPSTAASAELFDAARAQADAEGTVVSVTYPQLRADALVELATQAVTAAEHGGGLNVPAITALIDLAKLTDTHTCAGEPVGETDQGDKVTAEQARRLTCDCSLSRIVFDPTGATIDLGETARLPNPAMRRAIIARDRTCVFPGCDTPATRTHAHHLIHWTKDGPTDRDNLASLCSRHHHAVHEGGYGLTRAPDGSIHATRPDGTPLTVPKTNAPPPTTHGPDRTDHARSPHPCPSDRVEPRLGSPAEDQGRDGVSSTATARWSERRGRRSRAGAVTPRGKAKRRGAEGVSRSVCSSRGRWRNR